MNQILPYLKKELVSILNKDGIYLSYLVNLYFGAIQEEAGLEKKEAGLERERGCVQLRLDCGGPGCQSSLAPVTHPWRQPGSR